MKQETIFNGERNAINVDEALFLLVKPVSKLNILIHRIMVQVIHAKKDIRGLSKVDERVLQIICCVTHR